MHSTAMRGIDWFGYTSIATRGLLKGLDESLDADERGLGAEFIISTPLMSLNDALDLAETFVQTTATFAKYVRGIQLAHAETAEPVVESLALVVGGEVQSAVVRPGGFEWVKRRAGPSASRRLASSSCRWGGWSRNVVTVKSVSLVCCPTFIPLISHDRSGPEDVVARSAQAPSASPMSGSAHAALDASDRIRRASADSGRSSPSIHDR